MFNDPPKIWPIEICAYSDTTPLINFFFSSMQHSQTFYHLEKLLLFEFIAIDVNSSRRLTLNSCFERSITFKVITRWGFIFNSMQHLMDHVHEWCLPTACRYTGTVRHSSGRHTICSHWIWLKENKTNNNDNKKKLW